MVSWIIQVRCTIILIVICKRNFLQKHLDVIKTYFCHPKKLGNSDTWVLKVLLVASFDIQQYIFKLAMKSNAYIAMAKLLDVNPLTPLVHFSSIYNACMFFSRVFQVG